MSDLSFEQIQKAIRNGSLDSADTETLDRYLQGAQAFSKGRPIQIESRPPIFEDADRAVGDIQRLMAAQKEKESQKQMFVALQTEVRKLSKPHWLLKWTLAVAVLTLIVCVIGYWDQILRCFQVLKFWH